MLTSNCIGVVGDCVEVFCTHQNVQRLNQGIVAQEAYSSSIPHSIGVPEQMLSNITHTGDVGVGNTVFSDSQAGIENSKRDENRQNKARNQPQNRI